MTYTTLHLGLCIIFMSAAGTALMMQDAASGCVFLLLALAQTYKMDRT